LTAGEVSLGHDYAERALALAGVGTLIIDLRGRNVRSDNVARALLGLSSKRPLRSAARLLDLPSLRALRAHVPADSGALTLRVRSANGWRTIRASVALERSELLLTFTDITQYEEKASALAAQVDHLWHTVELNPQLPWFGDANGRIVGCTDRWLALTGLTHEEAMGHDGWVKVAHPEDIGRVFEAVMQSMASKQAMDVRLRVKVSTGDFRWMRAQAFPRLDQHGEVLSWYGYTEDINEHVLAEQRVRWTADHDSLTKLPNRAVFNQRLEQALGEDYVPGRKVGLMLIDVDNFKDVNDVLGHDAGDALLVAFAEMLSAALAPNVLLARIGGDEFAVLIQGDGGDFDLGSYCEAIYSSLKDSIIINGRTIDCRFSIGGAVYPLHGLSPTELFKNADIALYEAKARGKARFTLFSVEMKQLTQRRVAMINLGREAVESGSILPYYQIQMSLEDDRPVGFEALLRRKDRQGRICAPATIAAAFDDTEVAEALGNAMLTAVLSDMRRATDNGIDLGTVAINFSTAEFRSSTFVERLTERMDKAGIAYHRLGIEVTEGVLLGRQSDKAVETIAELNRLGFKIALDDFGTGYASLLHLRQIPVDTLKIDQSFIRNLTQSKDDHAIVAAIINLGESLGLNVIAEGIETEEQLEALRRLKLKRAQGYLFSRPVPIEQACALIEGYSRSPRLGLVGAA
jgi:diguanylate cyclase (GGDEF)-like protein/PAS domain S-box-containing protein